MISNRYLAVAAAWAISILGFSATFAQAESVDGPIPAKTRPDTSGDIEIDLNPVRSPYAVSQDAAIEYFKQLEEKVEQLGGGSISSITPPTQPVFDHLIAIYLYCSVKKGACPLVLESVLEIDVINSRVAKSASCPNMLNFWRAWKKGDMESKHRYLVKTAYMMDVANFNSKVRPRYLNCKDTVQFEIGGEISDSAFFQNRYSKGSTITKSIRELSQILTSLKVKVPNLLTAVGVK